MNFRPGHEVVGKVHVKHIYEIAKVKQMDAHLRHIELEQICRMIIGSVGSMGLELVGDEPAAVPAVKKWRRKINMIVW